MTARNAWDPRADFVEAQQMGDGIILELVNMEALGAAFAPFCVSRFSVAPGCATDEDRHRSRELWIVGSGKGELTYAGRAVEVKAGVACFFEAEHPHWIRNTGTNALHVFSVWWPA